MVPRPVKVVTLLPFIRARTPPVRVFTTLSLRPSMVGEIEADLVEFDAVFGGFLFREDEMVAGGEERLARDAADVETGAAEFAVLLDDGGLESELGGTNGRDVAARAGADDDDVKFIHGEKGLGAGGGV